MADAPDPDHDAEPVDSPYVRVAAYALCTDDRDRILLARISPGWPTAGHWTLPGGGLDWGEPPEQGVIRELEEETGLTTEGLDGVVSVYSGAHLRSIERPRDSVHVIGIVYRARRVTGTLRHEADGSTDRCAWFSRQEVEELPLVPLVESVLPHAWPEPQA